MNIKVIEPEHTRQDSRCCGSSCFNHGSTEETIMAINARISDFSCKDVAVYCVRCSRFLALGGMNTHYLIDLLFDETTTIPPKALKPTER